jgi:plasmid stabilization system protein ParE
MAVKRLEIHPAALEEFKSALVWYRERSVTAAGNFVAELDTAIDSVVQSPKRWPIGDHGTRKFVMQRFPFAVIYRETEAGIQIVAIAHGHRRPGYWKKRF